MPFVIMKFRAHEERVLSLFLDFFCRDAKFWVDTKTAGAKLPGSRIAVPTEGQAGDGHLCYFVKSYSRAEKLLTKLKIIIHYDALPTCEELPNGIYFPPSL